MRTCPELLNVPSSIRLPCSSRSRKLAFRCQGCIPAPTRLFDLAASSISCVGSLEMAAVSLGCGGAELAGLGFCTAWLCTLVPRRIRAEKMLAVNLFCKAEARISQNDSTGLRGWGSTFGDSLPTYSCTDAPMAAR